MKILLCSLLLCIGNLHAQYSTFTLTANKEVMTSAVTGTIVRIEYNYLELKIELYGTYGYITFSSGPKYVMTSNAGGTETHMIFNGYNSETGSGAKIHFFTRGDKVIRMIIEHSDYIFTYTRE